jgi:hypothetical protein
MREKSHEVRTRALPEQDTCTAVVGAMQGAAPPMKPSLPTTVQRCLPTHAAATAAAAPGAAQPPASSAPHTPPLRPYTAKSTAVTTLPGPQSNEKLAKAGSPPERKPHSFPGGLGGSSAATPMPGNGSHN